MSGRRPRSQSSHTYDILRVIDVDVPNLTIRFQDAAHAHPQSTQIRVDRKTPAAEQILLAMADSISVYGDGEWESGYGLKAVASRVGALVTRLTEAGIEDLGVATVGLNDLQAVIELFDPSMKRTLNKLLGRALIACHPNGDAISRALRNTRYMVEETRVELYDDQVADAIERAAMGVFHAAYKAQRALFRDLGYDTTGREWLYIPAEEVVAAARDRSASAEGGLRPPLTAPRVDLIDWALLNPHVFGVRTGSQPGRIPTIEAIGSALHPRNDVLAAALILHCLTELSGLNLSVMLRTGPEHLVRTGATNGVLNLSKARNHSEESLSVRTGSNRTLGGLIESLSGLTRFSRLARARRLSAGGDVPEVVDRLYVEHKHDLARSEVITNGRLHHGWRNRSFDAHWRAEGIERAEVGLRFNALRRKALERAIKIDPSADVHGHSERTKVHYLANILPDHTLVQHAGAAQDAILGGALARFQQVVESTTPNCAPLAEAVLASIHR